MLIYMVSSVYISITQPYQNAIVDLATESREPLLI
jgi:hypothetical protein